MVDTTASAWETKRRALCREPVSVPGTFLEHLTPITVLTGSAHDVLSYLNLSSSLCLLCIHFWLGQKISEQSMSGFLYLFVHTSITCLKHKLMIIQWTTISNPLVRMLKCRIPNIYKNTPVKGISVSVFVSFSHTNTEIETHTDTHTHTPLCIFRVSGYLSFETHYNRNRKYQQPPVTLAKAPVKSVHSLLR